MGGSAPPEADGKSVAERLSAAQKMKEKINAMLVAKGVLPKNAVKPSLHVQEITINDSPNRHVLIKRSTHQMVFERTKATITVRGHYVPPGGNAPLGQKPLYLYVTASSAEDLAGAEKIIKTILNAGQTQSKGGDDSLVIHTKMRKQKSVPTKMSFPTNIGSTSKAGVVTKKVPIRLTVSMCKLMEYPLLEKLSGPEDAYLKHINQTSGATINIAGAGTQMSPGEALHFRVTATSNSALNSAATLAQNLLDTIYQDYQVKTSQTSSSVPPPAAPTSSAPTLPPGIGNQSASHAYPQQPHSYPGYSQNQYAYPQGGYPYYNHQYAGYGNMYGGYSAAPPPYMGPATTPSQDSKGQTDYKVDEADDSDSDEDRNRRRRDRNRRRRDRSPSTSPPRRKRFSEGPVKRKFEEDSPPRKRSFREEAPERRTFSEDSGKVLTYVPLVMMQSKVNAFAHITVPSRINFPDSFYSRIEIEIEIFPTFFEYALLSLNVVTVILCVFKPETGEKRFKFTTPPPPPPPADGPPPPPPTIAGQATVHGMNESARSMEKGEWVSTGLGRLVNYGDSDSEKEELEVELIDKDGDKYKKKTPKVRKGKSVAFLTAAIAYKSLRATGKSIDQSAMEALRELSQEDRKLIPPMTNTIKEAEKQL
eukprot:CAMPEP_0114538086 /NCGR_PEP_ID=MMETSP0109-20121206/29942_1 /TAXON_ID=29199 /ORGANISM="Chlorarachnion reptans, Strain CCCM449" /LENGTH=646 /DNA_ID=CAMNT_0001722055 /DNA_START=1 /DNA_END=1939 /DNA_ORIENTATION=+